MTVHGSRLRSALWLLSASVLLLPFYGCSQDHPTDTLAGSDSRGEAPRFTRIAGAEAPDVARAMAVQDRHWTELDRIDGVVGAATSLDETGTPIILVLADRDVFADLPRTLEGVPTRMRVVGGAVAFAPPSQTPTLLMGTSTANDYYLDGSTNCIRSGTIGCTVVSGRIEYFLSCNHIFANENLASIGDPIVAPSRADDRNGVPCDPTPVVAELSDFEPIVFGGINEYDAAIARVGRKTKYSCAMAGGYTPTSTPIEAQIGMAVKKTGRTTLVTTGTVTAINATITVTYATAAAEFRYQIQVEGPAGFARQGDSGALAVSDPGNQPLGLVIAGDPSDGNPTYVSRIVPILTRFNAVVCSD